MLPLGVLICNMLSLLFPDIPCHSDTNSANVTEIRIVELPKHCDELSSICASKGYPWTNSTGDDDSTKKKAEEFPGLFRDPYEDATVIEEPFKNNGSYLSQYYIAMEMKQRSPTVRYWHPTMWEEEVNNSTERLIVDPADVENTTSVDGLGGGESTDGADLRSTSTESYSLTSQSDAASESNEENAAGRGRSRPSTGRKSKKKCKNNKKCRKDDNKDSKGKKGEDQSVELASTSKDCSTDVHVIAPLVVEHEGRTLNVTRFQRGYQMIQIGRCSSSASRKNCIEGTRHVWLLVDTEEEVDSQGVEFALIQYPSHCNCKHR